MVGAESVGPFATQKTVDSLSVSRVFVGGAKERARVEGDTCTVASRGKLLLLRL